MAFIHRDRITEACLSHKRKILDAVKQPGLQLPWPLSVKLVSSPLIVQVHIKPDFEGAPALQYRSPFGTSGALVSDQELGILGRFLSFERLSADAAASAGFITEKKAIDRIIVAQEKSAGSTSDEVMQSFLIRNDHCLHSIHFLYARRQMRPKTAFVILRPGIADQPSRFVAHLVTAFLAAETELRRLCPGTISLDQSYGELCQRKVKMQTLQAVTPVRWRKTFQSLCADHDFYRSALLALSNFVASGTEVAPLEENSHSTALYREHFGFDGFKILCKRQPVLQGLTIFRALHVACTSSSSADRAAVDDALAARTLADRLRAFCSSLPKVGSLPVDEADVTHSALETVRSISNSLPKSLQVSVTPDFFKLADVERLLTRVAKAAFERATKPQLRRSEFGEWLSRLDCAPEALHLRAFRSHAVQQTRFIPDRSRHEALMLEPMRCPWHSLRCRIVACAKHLDATTDALWHCLLESPN